MEPPVTRPATATDNPASATLASSTARSAGPKGELAPGFGRGPGACDCVADERRPPLIWVFSTTPPKHESPRLRDMEDSGHAQKQQAWGGNTPKPLSCQRFCRSASERSEAAPTMFSSPESIPDGISGPTDTPRAAAAANSSSPRGEFKRLGS